MSFTASLDAIAGAHGLITMGTVGAPNGIAHETLHLLGTGPGFWPIFKASPEYLDQSADPLDRWSQRVLPEIADCLPIHVLDIVYPFTGPPYAPFLRWAMDSGAAHQSPVGMLVHNHAGLMISYRGGLIVQSTAPILADHSPSPCDTAHCAQPCKHACPVDALSAERGYDVDACHRHLDTDNGQDCLKNGCKARRACPISIRFGRDPAQSAFHMRAFHP